jgi:CRISPR-associated protein Cas6
MADQPVVDLSFPIGGGAIPADHGYALYAALCRLVPEVHGDETIGVHPIRGRLVGGRQLALTDASRLVLRMSADRIPALLRLAGQRMELDGARVSVGVPSVRPLRPAPALVSRLVVIKGFMEPDEFVQAAQRQIESLGARGRAALVARRQPGSLEGGTARASGEPIRRTLRIRDKAVVGFALAVTELTAEESVRIQEVGIGGRRRFGCGVFVPFSGASTGGP